MDSNKKNKEQIASKLNEVIEKSKSQEKILKKILVQLKKKGKYESDRQEENTKVGKR